MPEGVTNLSNTGQINVTHGTVEIGGTYSLFSNTGQINVTHGALNVGSEVARDTVISIGNYVHRLLAGEWNIGAGGRITLPGASILLAESIYIAENDANVTLSGDGAFYSQGRPDADASFGTFLYKNDLHGVIRLEDGKNLNTDSDRLHRFTNAGQMVLSAATLTIDGGGTNTFYNTSSGKLLGSGTLVGGLENHGLVSPGFSPGSLEINGDFLQGPAGVLSLEIGGNTPGVTYDQLLVTGTAELGGTLDLHVLSPLAGNTTFTLIDAQSISGSFSKLPEIGSNLGYGVHFAGLSFDRANGDVLMSLTVPEPSSYVLAMLGFAALIGWRRASVSSGESNTATCGRNGAAGVMIAGISTIGKRW